MSSLVGQPREFVRLASEHFEDLLPKRDSSHDALTTAFELAARDLGYWSAVTAVRAMAEALVEPRGIAGGTRPFR